MKEMLQKLREASVDAILQADDITALENLRVKYLGKKGELTAILKQMGRLSAEERPAMGQLANQVRAELEEALDQRREALNARMNTFSYRFRATSRGLLWLVWLAAAGMLVFSFTLAPFLGPGYQAVFLPLALACIAWAVWASIPPKV